MHFEDVRQWQGTAEALAKEVTHQIEQFQLLIEPPALRTVRLWRSRHLLSQPKGQEFSFRQILEALATTLLLKKGWTLAAIGQVLPAFSDDALEKQILAESSGQDPTWLAVTDNASLSLSTRYRQVVDLAEDAVMLLAQGIIRQYDRVLSEREIVRQEDSMPPEIYTAMCKLGRLYIEAGVSDQAACIHSVLNRARYALDHEQWNLDIFRRTDFRFSGVTLIDPDLRVPTSDCSLIANLSGAFGEDNVIEHRLHTRLREATERLSRRHQHRAYTALRELVGRRSLIGERELLDYLVENDLTPLQGMITDTFFDPVPEIWLIEGLANRCNYCGTLMRPHPHQKLYPEGHCPVRQCNHRHSPKVSRRLNPAQDRPLVAKPQILTYWTGPAIDELAIFDAARQKELNAELYPEADLCDIAINGRLIGIDAKSYTSPISLALRLNRSIGGLMHYRRRILAISDQLIEDNPSYLSTLQSTLDKKGDPATLEVLTVSAVIRLLEEMPYAS